MEAINEKELNEEMRKLIELMKKHFKEEANMNVVATCFGDVDSFTVVQEGRANKYGIIIPIEWKQKDLKGQNIEELAANLTFKRAYRIKDMLD